MKNNPAQICQACQARGRFIAHRRAVVYRHALSCRYLQTTVKAQHSIEKASNRQRKARLL